jgi:hypothetical protein
MRTTNRLNKLHVSAVLLALNRPALKKHPARSPPAPPGRVIMGVRHED